MPTERTPPVLYLRCAKCLICHISGVGTPKNWAYIPEIQCPPRALYSAPTPKFHHPIFNHLEIIMFTDVQTNTTTNNKQRDSVKNIRLTSLCYASDIYTDIRYAL